MEEEVINSFGIKFKVRGDLTACNKGVPGANFQLGNGRIVHYCSKRRERVL